MTTNQKKALLGAGILAGAAAGYYLNTPQGRQVVQTASNKIKEQTGNAGSALTSAYDSARSYVSDLMGSVSGQSNNKQVAHATSSSSQGSQKNKQTSQHKPAHEMEDVGNGSF